MALTAKVQSSNGSLRQESHLCLPPDIDECELGMDNCDPIARCVNTIGSFRCECPSGYSGDGIVCEGQAAPGLLSGPVLTFP